MNSAQKIEIYWKQINRTTQIIQSCRSWWRCNCRDNHKMANWQQLPTTKSGSTHRSNNIHRTKRAHISTHTWHIAMSKMQTAWYRISNTDAVTTETAHKMAEWFLRQQTPTHKSQNTNNGPTHCSHNIHRTKRAHILSPTLLKHCSEQDTNWHKRTAHNHAWKTLLQLQLSAANT